ncbi:hypothetical protein RJ641_036756, partial [Dillenia turbinata]
IWDHRSIEFLSQRSRSWTALSWNRGLGEVSRIEKEKEDQEMWRRVTSLSGLRYSSQFCRLHQSISHFYGAAPSGRACKIHVEELPIFCYILQAAYQDTSGFGTPLKEIIPFVTFVFGDHEDASMNPSDESKREIEDNCDHQFVLKEDIGDICRVCGVIGRATNTIIDFQYIKVLTAIGNFCICSIAVGISLCSQFNDNRLQFNNNLLVLLIGGIPIVMPIIPSMTMAIGSHHLSLQKQMQIPSFSLMAGQASSVENQDAIDAAIVGMLVDPKGETRCGEGVNDALALENADMSIAVAYATDAACGALDIDLIEPSCSGFRPSTCNRDDFRMLALAVYLQVSTISQAFIFVTRTRRWSFVEHPRSSPHPGFCSGSAYNFGSIKGICWGWADVIWLYDLIFYFPLDIVKFATRYALSGKAWDLGTEWRGC